MIMSASLFNSSLSTLGTDTAFISKMVNQQGHGLSSSEWTLLGWHPQDCVHSVPSSSPELEEFPQGRGEIFHLQPLQSISDIAVCTPVGLGCISLPRTARPLLSLLCITELCPLICSKLKRVAERSSPQLPTHEQPLALPPTSHAHTKDIPQTLLAESEKEDAWEERPCKQFTGIKEKKRELSSSNKIAT